MPLHVCLVDDDDWIRADVGRALGAGERGLTLSSFGTARETLAAMERGEPFDVVLVDLGLPDLTGQALIRELRRKRGELPIVAFTVREDDDAIFEALRAGAVGYITKHASLADLLAAVCAAAEGAAPLSPRVSRRVVSRFWPDPRPAPNIDAVLTPREREVLELLCTAASYREVATLLGISEGTVQSHVKKIYGKLGVNSKAEAVLLACRRRWPRMSDQADDRMTPPVRRGPPFSVGIPGAHAALRSTSSVISFSVAALVFIALMLIPAFTRTVKVSFAGGATVTALTLLSFLVATAVYRTWGISRAYYWADLVEGLTTEGFCAYLVIGSGNVIHFVWLFYFFHVVLTAGAGVTLRNLVVVAAAPAAVALRFAVGANPGSALVAVLGGVLGVAFYVVVGRTYDQVESGRRREAELKTRLAELRVAQERVRIARDLHDSVGSELAALVWRARVLAQDAPQQGRADDLSALERRAVTALDQLRDVVLGLRADPMEWSEATAALARRCHDQCRDMKLDFVVEGELDTRTQASLWLEVQRIVLELVRNAVTHAGGNCVGVRLRAGAQLDLSVNDNGHGIQNTNWRDSPGGLANVRARVQNLAGEMNVDSDASGTRIQIRLPPAD
jgi:DNA-binding NarL/FixJ family response regulator/signal transduction histidine kinase